MHISTLIVRNMLSWMLSYIHVHILHKVQTFPHKENTCVFPFGRSHFTHARILHVLPSLQQETWCTFTDSQGSANNIHTHGCKSRYTLEYTNGISTLKHCFSLLWHVQAHIFTLVISTTHTCRHWHIHSHKHTQISFTWILSHTHVHQFSSVQFSRYVMSDSLRPHESQHARPPCPSPSPGVHSDSCPSSPLCYPAIPSSVVPFSYCRKSQDQKLTHTHEICVPTRTHSFTHAGQQWHNEEHTQVFICTQ